MDTPSVALQKLKHFCAYQERCHQEVREKLRQLGLWGEDAEEIIADLVTGNYLNEERFARGFAGGRFRLKKWGRRKISQALKMKDVSPYCIRKGLSEIDEEAYLQTLEALARHKYESLRGEQYLRRRYKTTQYLISRGYEPELIARALESVAGA
jgi:regulatory protein